MIKKQFYKGGKRCRVWFYLPAEVNAKNVYLVGDFNGWDEAAQPMKIKQDGSFYTDVTLDTGKAYQYRYLLDRRRWENDWEADAYAFNDMGTENSVVEV